MRRTLRIAGVAALLGPMALLGACGGQTGSPPGVGSASPGSSEVEAPAAATAVPSAEPDPSVEAEPSATYSPAKDAAWAARGMKLVGMPAGLGEAWYWYDSNGPFVYAVSADEVWITGEDELVPVRGRGVARR